MLQQKEAGTQLYPFVVLAIFHGGKSLCFSKDLGEVAEGGEAQQLGDLGHGQVGFG